MLKQIEFVEKDMTDSDFKISNLGTLIFILYQCYFGGGGGMRNIFFPTVSLLTSEHVLNDF